MKYLLFALSLACLAAACLILVVAESALHEQIAGQAFICAAILYSASAIVAKMDELD